MVGLGSLWTHLLAYLLVMNVQIDLEYSLCLDERCTLGLNVCNSSLLGNVHVGMAWVVSGHTFCLPSTHGRQYGAILLSVTKVRVYFGPNCLLSFYSLLIAVDVLEGHAIQYKGRCVTVANKYVDSLDCRGHIGPLYVHCNGFMVVEEIQPLPTHYTHITSPLDNTSWIP